MSAAPGAPSQPPLGGAPYVNGNSNRLSPQYGALPGANGRASPTPDGRHISDLQAEASRRIGELGMTSIPKLLGSAETSLRVAESLLNHRGRRDQAYVEYLVASEIAVNQIPRAPEYPTMRTSAGQNVRIFRELILRLKSNEDRFAKIKEIIVNENTRNGVTSRQNAVPPSLQVRQPPSEVSRPQGHLSGVGSGSAVSSAWFDGNVPTEKTSRPPVSDSDQSSTTTTVPTSNLQSQSPKARPVIRPKPESLHGNAINSRRNPLNGSAPADLNERFARLRAQNLTASHTRTEPSTSNGTVARGSVRMSSPTNFKPDALATAIPLSLRPAGPRTMPASSSGPAPPPKLPLNTQLAAAMPKPPSPTYSPARNMQTPTGMNPPRSTVRSIVGTGGRSNSMAASSAASNPPGSDLESGSYFPNSNGQKAGNANRRQGIIGLPAEMRTITAHRLFDSLRMYDILLIDVRSRDEFDYGHIDSSKIMCIEPLELRQGISAEDIQNSLSIAPDAEHALFNDRDQFDLVVYYDQSTDNDNFLTSLTRSQREETLKILFDALTEYNYDKPLKTPPPLLLKGGITAWVDLLGKAALMISSTASSKVPTSNRLARRPVPVPSQSSSLAIEKKRRREWNPLNAEEERQWAEQARTESIRMPPMPDESLTEEPEDEEDLAFYRSQEEFFRRYPAVPLEQESMVSPPPRIDSKSPSQPPSRPLSGVIAMPAYPPISATSHQEMPVRPQPAAPRVSYSGAHDRNSLASYNSGRTQQLRPYVPARDLPHNIRLPRTGLINFGVTCYMNATIQCLNATLPLTRIFKDGSYRKYLQKDNWKGSRGLLPEHYANLVQHLWVGDVMACRPSTFRNFCARLNREWGSERQQDANEFYSFVIDFLHEDLNIYWRNPPPHVLSAEEEASREKQPLFVAAGVEWDRWSKRDKSIISDLFAGQHASRLSCLACGHTSTTYEPWYSISVEIPPSGRTDLTSCLTSYCREERLQQGEEWRCPHCNNRKREATKKIIFTRAPRFLVVHFKRFSASHAESARKIRTVVDFPLHGLDLGPFMLPQPREEELRLTKRTLDDSMIGPFRYDAYAVIRHLGASISSGHYVSLVKDRGRGVWRTFNDDKVSDFDENTTSMGDRIQGEGAYIVFFERVPMGEKA